MSGRIRDRLLEHVSMEMTSGYALYILVFVVETGVKRSAV